MTDLKDRLDDLVAREAFAPLDAGSVIGPGRRALRRRRVATVVGSAAAVVVLALVVGVAVRWVTQPTTEFGDPAGRRPADTSIPTEQAYADLVTSRQGDRYVSITGFGWPLAEMDPDDISKLDAESMCLPMLRAAASEVPASAWRHSESWVDTFPSRATLPTMYEAEHDGRTYNATCALPGDDVPTRRVDLDAVPSASDAVRIRQQCAYLSHVDLSHWTVASAADGVAGVVAVLRGPDRVATCVLTNRRAARSVQVSERTDPPPPEQSYVVHTSGRSAFVAGVAPAGTTEVQLRFGDREAGAGVVDGLFAVATPTPATRGTTARLTAYDAAGDELASWTSTESAGEGSLLPPDCFYSLETDNDGC